MHGVIEQIERVAMITLLLLFGGALVSGLLSAVTWTDAIIAVVILLSIVLHGLTVMPVMRMLDRQHGRDPDVDDEALARA